MKFSSAAAVLACGISVAAADFTTYIGDAYQYTVTAIAVDSAGNTYATGSRAVTVSPSATANDVFITKIDPAGNVTLVATFSGKVNDQANGIAVDPAGNIYIAGNSTSPNFPLLHALQTTPGPMAIYGTGFLVKIKPDGTPVYSTYIGGTAGPSIMNAVAADAQGNAYITGQTFAKDYPRTAGMPAGGAGGGLSPGSVSAAFVAKISPAGDKIVYAGGIASTTRACGAGSTCFLSTLANVGTGIALDPAGNAYVSGNAYGTGLPTTPGVLQPSGIGGFVAKVKADGTGLAYLTLLSTANNLFGGAMPGSNPATLAYAIAADATGAAYVSGATSDPNFPATPGAFQSKLPVPPISPTFPPASAFVAKLDSAGTSVVWASFLGGTQNDLAHTIALDPSGDVWLSGTAQSTDFPITSGFPGGTEYLAEFNPTGSSMLYGARYPTASVSTALAIDPAGVLHYAGISGLVATLTPGQPAVPRIFGLTNAAFSRLSGRVSPGEAISIYGLHLSPETSLTIDGAAAPILYTSDTQINAVTPLALQNTTTATLRLSVSAADLPEFRLAVDVAIPEVFRMSDGSAAAINQDGTLNSKDNPAKAGSIVSIWATGTGWIQGTDGQIQTEVQPFGTCAIYNESHQGAVVTYSGAAPGLITGIVQINFQVNGTGPFTLTNSGKVSSPFNIYTAP